MTDWCRRPSSSAKQSYVGTQPRRFALLGWSGFGLRCSAGDGPCSVIWGRGSRARSRRLHQCRPVVAMIRSVKDYGSQGAAGAGGGSRYRKIDMGGYPFRVCFLTSTLTLVVRRNWWKMQVDVFNKHRRGRKGAVMDNWTKFKTAYSGGRVWGPSAARPRCWALHHGPP